MKRSLLFLTVFVPGVVACSSDPDAAASDPSTRSDGGSSDGRDGAGRPPVDCSGVSNELVELFRSPGGEAWNVMGLWSDGTHLHIAGHGQLSPSGPAPTPDPANPMKTATLLRVPVAGGAKEVVEFEHGTVSRGVVADQNEIYWASDYRDSLLARPKGGGTVRTLTPPGSPGSPQSVSTDGRGNVFWATMSGSIAAFRAGAPDVSIFQESAGDADDALWVKTDGVSVYWLAGRSELRSAPIAGGAATTLATGIEWVYSLETDATHVWGISNNELWRLAKSGGQREIVARPAAGRDFRSLAVADDAIYFSDDMEPSSGGGKVVKGPVFRANKDGTEAKAITPEVEGAAHMTVDACRVYFSTFEWVGNPGYELVVYGRARTP